MYLLVMSDFPLSFRKKPKRDKFKNQSQEFATKKGNGKGGMAVGMERILSGASASRLSFQSSLVLMYPQELASHLAPTSTQALALASAFSNGGRSGVRESGGKSNREREREGDGSTGNLF